MPTFTDAQRGALSKYLTAAAGQPVAVLDTAPLAGGASREMWALTLQTADAVERVVLRRDPPTQMTGQALARVDEAALMTAARAAGVPVARVRWACGDPAVLGSPFFIMDWVEGTAVGRKVVTQPDLAAARAALPAQMGAALAGIHRLDPAALPFLRAPAGSPALDAVEFCWRTLDGLGAQRPALEYALRWAAGHAPACDRLTVNHGDFRIGNLLVNADGLAAVADWEFAHVGDPHEDLGYPCMRDWRFGVGRLRLGGISDREPFFAAYEAAGGGPVERAAADYWEILGSIRWGVIALAQAERHRSGREPSIELASLGRRAVEMEYEALRGIERWAYG